MSSTSETKNVHIVDDDRLARYLIVRCCKAAFKEVVTHEYATAEEFIEYLDKTIAGEVDDAALNNSLVTMDINMPGMGGLKALDVIEDRINEQGLARGLINCLVVTSSSNYQDQQRVEACSFVSSFVTKPLSIEFLKTIDGHSEA